MKTLFPAGGKWCLSSSFLRMELRCRKGFWVLLFLSRFGEGNRFLLWVLFGRVLWMCVLLLRIVRGVISCVYWSVRIILGWYPLILVNRMTFVRGWLMISVIKNELRISTLVSHCSSTIFYGIWYDSALPHFVLLDGLFHFSTTSLESRMNYSWKTSEVIYSNFIYKIRYILDSCFRFCVWTVATTPFWNFFLLMLCNEFAI